MSNMTEDIPPVAESASKRLNTFLAVVVMSSSWLINMVTKVSSDRALVSEYLYLNVV